MDDHIKTLIHNIRNPVNTISINAELGKLSLQRNQDMDKALEIFDLILRECRQCGEQINSLKNSLEDSADGSEPKR